MKINPQVYLNAANRLFDSWQSNQAGDRDVFVGCCDAIREVCLYPEDEQHIEKMHEFFDWKLRTPRSYATKEFGEIWTSAGFQNRILALCFMYEIAKNEVSIKRKKK